MTRAELLPRDDQVAGLLWKTVTEDQPDGRAHGWGVARAGVRAWCSLRGLWPLHPDLPATPAALQASLPGLLGGLMAQSLQITSPDLCPPTPSLSQEVLTL